MLNANELDLELVNFLIRYSLSELRPVNYHHLEMLIIIKRLVRPRVNGLLVGSASGTTRVVNSLERLIFKSIHCALSAPEWDVKPFFSLTLLPR